MIKFALQARDKLIVKCTK